MKTLIRCSLANYDNYVFLDDIYLCYKKEKQTFYCYNKYTDKNLGSISDELARTLLKRMHDEEVHSGN